MWRDEKEDSKIQLEGFVNKRLLNVTEKVFLEWFLFVSRGQIKGYKASIGREMVFLCILLLKNLKKEPRGFFSI